MAAPAEAPANDQDLRQGVWLAVLKGPRTFAEQIVTADDFNSLAEKVQVEYGKGKRIHALHVPNSEQDHSPHVAVMRDSTEAEKVIFADNAADLVKQSKEAHEDKFRIESVQAGDGHLFGILRGPRSNEEAVVHNTDFAGFVGGIQTEYNTKKHSSSLAYSATTKEWLCVLKPPGENSGQIVCGQTLEALFAELQQGYTRGERTRTVIYSCDFDMWLAVMKSCPADSPGEQVIVANQLSDLTFLIEQANKEGRYVETLVYASGAQEVIPAPERAPAPDYRAAVTVLEAPKPTEDELNEIAKRLAATKIGTPATAPAKADEEKKESEATEVKPLPKVGPRKPIKPMPTLHKKKIMPGNKSKLQVRKAMPKK